MHTCALRIPCEPLWAHYGPAPCNHLKIGRIDNNRGRRSRQSRGMRIRNQQRVEQRRGWVWW